MSLTLTGYLIRQVSPERYFNDVFPGLPKPNSEGEVKVLSPFVKETMPSLSVNVKTGEWYSFCEADRRGGNNIVSFQAALLDCTNAEAAAQLYHKYVHPVVDSQLIEKWQRKLAHNTQALGYLKHRCISGSVVKQYKIGWNGVRYTIPIYNEFDLCVNVRLYDPLAKDKAFKIINYTKSGEKRSYGSPVTLYPIQQLLNPNTIRIVLCEGEWDTLSLISLGISAVTGTGGVNTWKDEFNHYFTGKKVVVAFDNDKAGIEASRKVVPKLAKVALSLKRVLVPNKYGKDVNDLLIKNRAMRNKGAWLNWFEKTKSIIQNKNKGNLSTAVKELQECASLSLSEATNEKYFGKRVSVQGIITAKDLMPYILPKEYQISCTQGCEDCPISATEYGFKKYTIDTHDPEMLLSLLDMTDRSKRAHLLGRAGLLSMGDKCKAKLKVMSAFNVEFLLIIPTLEHRTHEYSISPSYYVGHGLKVNRPYQFSGYVLPHPKDQHAVFLFDKAEPLQDEIETFKLTDSIGASLTKFRPRNLPLIAHLMALAEWQSRNVTKIIGRPDLHIIVDLAFHSLASFKFNGELVPRGMLDALVIGDTRCGKGYVAQGLSRFYGLGDIASGDSCSFAGLVGGLQQIRNNWRITWGLLPLNNNRLVIIDEASSMSVEDIARMSRIRSEGVAEIVKIIRESTNANTRILWLANPRSGRPILSYNTGVEAIKELAGALEDISRFDLALTLATNEVEAWEINTICHDTSNDSDKYPARDCRNLLLWAWSRTVDQVVFTPQATQTIMSLAIELSQIYSSVIPLIQGETIRIKLAKLSAAVAARVFSTDETYKKVIVRDIHVQCVEHFIKNFYNKRSMSYDLYSQSSAVSSHLKEFDTIIKVIQSYSARSELATVSGLAEMNYITIESMADYVGDLVSARDLLGELVVLRCLAHPEGRNYYLKNSGFSQWIRKRKSELSKKGPGNATTNRKD